MEANFPFATRQGILNFPFPYKLWLVVNLEYCDFLQWNRDGTVILLDLIALEDYLNSLRSIFKIKNSSSFLKHLEEFQFERLNLTPEADEDLLLQYKNENFQRHRLDLLAKMRRHTYQLIGQLPTQNIEQNHDAPLQDQYPTNIPKRVAERMLGDLCFMFHGGLSRIKRSRLRFQTVLHFNKEKRTLKEKLKASETTLNVKSKSETANRSVSGYSTSEDDQVIELPVDLFENPHDSVLNLGEDFFPEYAGYYGNCSTDQIKNFFGEYLPMYENGSMEVKKVMTDNSAGTSNKSFLTTTETNGAQYYSPNTTGNPNCAYASTPIEQNRMHNINFSSNLEPIFISNETSDDTVLNYNSNNNYTITYYNSNTISNEVDVSNSDSLNNGDDISMEEFLNFKSAKNENDSTNSQHITSKDNEVNNTSSEEDEITKTFPQMPTSFQMKLNEDVQENEANFRNFFSHYRASLNLLYERQ